MREHFSESDISSIKNNINEKIQVIDKTISWVDSNLKYEEKSNLLLTLKSSSNTLRKIKSKIDSKPVIAVFGASQVGKSYLIKNLLSLPQKPFIIRDGVQEYDFLKDINPPGTGAESTGVVTRFTIDDNVKFIDFPVKIRLLNPKDILVIILDSFFLDLKKILSFISKKELEVHIKKFELSEGDNISQKYLDELDVLEIKKYFESHLSKHTILFEGLTESRFFERIGKIINKFDHTKWADIFEVLWNKNPKLTKVFNLLIENLNKVGYSDYGYIEFKNVLRGKGEILDVKRLKEINSVTEDTTFKKENGDELQINISYLSALISELIFSIPQDLVETKEFLKNSDLLDFPGARTRLGIEEENIDKNIHEMLLRGKVSYLFNKYTDDFSINNLLFCSNDKQLEISELSSLLFNWISKNIGENEDERSRSLGNSTISPLFVIFTFFNNQIRFDTTNDVDFQNFSDKLDYKWETRFVRFFENEIVTKAKDWHIKWSYVSPAFQNFYLLRDFKYSTDVFEGFENEGFEKKIKSEREFFMNCLKDSFVNYPFVKKHFINPKESWNLSTTPNNDGSELIIKNLSAVSNNVTKTRHYLNLINSTILNLKEDLVKFIHTDDVSAQRMKNMTQASTFQLQFNLALTKDFNLFNELIDKLSVKPVEVYNLLNEKAVQNASKEEISNVRVQSILLTQYPELEKAQSYDEAIEILKNKMWLPSKEAVEKQLNAFGIKKEEIFKPKQSTRTRSELYTDIVLDFWNSQIRNRSAFSNLEDNGVTFDSINFIIEHLTTILKKRNIREKLILILKDIVSEIEIDYSNNVFLAETFSMVINDLVYNLDMNFISNEEKTEIRKMTSTDRNSYFERHPMTDEATISSLFDNSNLDVKTISLEKYNRWLELLRISLLINSGFVNYDEKSNEELKSLTEGYTELQMN